MSRPSPDRRSGMRSAAAFIALLAGVLTAGTAARAQLAEDGDVLAWHDSYSEAVEEARHTGKPIFLEFRCAP